MYLILFIHWVGIFELVIARHLQTMNVNWSASFDQFEYDGHVGELENGLNWTSFAGFQNGHWYLDLGLGGWRIRWHRWCFDLFDNKFMNKLFSPYLFHSKPPPKNSKICNIYLDHIVFVFLGLMTEQNLTNHQLVEWAWIFFAVCVHAPCHAFVGGVKGDTWE